MHLISRFTLGKKILTKNCRVENQNHIIAYPNEKSIQRAQILVIHIILDLHLGIGLVLSFQPCNANLVARNPTTIETPNIANLTSANGRQTIILIHSYIPVMDSVRFMNGSIGHGGGRVKPVAPMNSYGFKSDPSWSEGLDRTAGPDSPMSTLTTKSADVEGRSDSMRPFSTLEFGIDMITIL